MIEKIYHEEKVLAIIIGNKFQKDGIEFFTPGDYSQQLGYMKRPTGYVIQPHRHNKVSREVITTQEVLFIKTGKVRVDFFDDDETYLESRILEQGDIILLAAGGHGFEIIETAEIIEVKQGPYCGDEDKVRFDASDQTQIKMDKQ